MELEVYEKSSCETEMYDEVYLDRTEKNNSKWLELMTEALKGAKTFEIHCWNELRNRNICEGNRIDIKNERIQLIQLSGRS